MSKKIFSKEPQKFNEKLAEALKKFPEFEVPEWMAYVKSGVSKERPPVDENFWFKRTASILRQLYIEGVVGVNRLKTRYGSRKNRGGRRAKFFKASGKIIRVILQQAEKAGLVEKVERLQHGRRLTLKGREFLDSIEVEETKGIDFDEVVVEEKQIEQETFEEESEINDGDDDEQETE